VGSGGASGGGATTGGGSAGAMLADAGGARTPICPAGTQWGAPLASPTITAAPLNTSFKFIEGPVWIAELSALFFSDMDFSLGNTAGWIVLMHKYTPPSTFEDFIPMANTNGLAVGANGQILACTHDQQTLSYFDPVTKARTTLPLTYMGKHFNSPNDLAVRSDGHIYFTDPDYELGNRPSETKMQGVYHVAPDNTVTLIEGSLRQPNGIALSPDGKTLYIGSLTGMLLKYPVMADGSTGPASPFASINGPDGMSVDCAGNVYVTSASGTVVVLSPGGAVIGTIQGLSQPSNLAFGGSGRKTLFISGGSTLYSAPVNVPGYPY
jgi:gluconolactonase